MRTSGNETIFGFNLLSAQVSLKREHGLIANILQFLNAHWRIMLKNKNARPGMRLGYTCTTNLCYYTRLALLVKSSSVLY